MSCFETIWRQSITRAKFAEPLPHEMFGTHPDLSYKENAQIPSNITNLITILQQPHAQHKIITITQ